MLRMNMITLTYGAILKGRKSKATGDKYRMSTSTSTIKTTTQATWNQEEEDIYCVKSYEINILSSVQHSTNRKEKKKQ